MTDEEKIRQYLDEGFCPVPTSHLGKQIRDALDAMGLQPGMKECFANCQKFVTMNERRGLGLDVVYVEGWVQSIIPMEHAWILHRGSIVDLTLSPDRKYPTQYLGGIEYSAEDVLANMIETGTYSPIDQERLFKIGPFYEQWKQLEALNR
jgi:hypothetical protein